MKITMAHGGGGRVMDELIHSIFIKHFQNETLARMEDAAVLTLTSSRVAFTTDSFVVSPLFFKGGDIGKLAVCGTVNDLSMRGAVPRYLSCGFILEEGLDTDTLSAVAASMRRAADEAGVQIVAGDTKVVEGKGGLYINTAGIGVFEKDVDISVQNAQPGDAVLISGTLGRHHACILSSRMGIENDIQSDCAPLNGMVQGFLDAGLQIHTLRDITRGGLATVLNEAAMGSGVQITLHADAALADTQVQGFCDILGLDPLYMGNEGRMAVILPADQAEKALAVMRQSPYGLDARMVGEVAASDAPKVILQTRSGGTRRVQPLPDEGLPRIC